MLHLKQASDLALPTCSVGAKIKASHNHLLILCNQNASLPVLLQPYCICSNLNNCFAGAEFPQRYISGQLKAKEARSKDKSWSGVVRAVRILLCKVSTDNHLPLCAFQFRCFCYHLLFILHSLVTSYTPAVDHSSGVVCSFQRLFI